MKGQRIAVYVGALATVLTTAVAGLAARAMSTQTGGDDRRIERRQVERQVEREAPRGQGERRVIRLDGPGSQLGVIESDQ